MVCSGIIQILGSELVKILWIDCKDERKDESEDKSESVLIVFHIEGDKNWKIGKIKIFFANTKIGNDETKISTIMREITKITDVENDGSESSYESEKKKSKKDSTLKEEEKLKDEQYRKLKEENRRKKTKEVEDSIGLIINKNLGEIVVEPESEKEALLSACRAVIDTKSGLKVYKTIKNEFAVVIENTDTELEIKIYKELEKAFVQTFPLRSIGACQWSRSKRLAPQFHDKNYSDAIERAEIINALEFCPTPETNNEVNKTKAREIFNFITFPSEFVFESELKDNKIVVRDLKSDKGFPLLKIPEGILEALQFSLLMALKNVKTICFEEPDRGMHPQYIERMREMLIKNCIGKCVIIVTHSQYLINTSTARNTHVFFRLPEEEHKTPYGFYSMSMAMATDSFNRHLTDLDEIKKVAFASKVLFVEGKSDKIVLEGIYEHLSTRSNMDHDTLSNIISRQIVVQGQCTKPSHLTDLCKGINLDAVWLIDFDTHVLVDKDNKIARKRDLNTNIAPYVGKDLDNFRKVDFKTFRDALTAENEFTWKFGDIEDVIMNDLSTEQIEYLFEIPKVDQADKYKESKSKIKKKLKTIETASLEKLSEYLMNSTAEEKEMCCFVDFLKSKTTKTGGKKDSLN